MSQKKNIDSELITGLKQDSHESFQKLFEIYGQPLYQFSLSYLKSRADAEGLVQDVFLKIWENRTKLKKDSSLKSYIFTIAYHQICAYFRKKQMHTKYEAEIEFTSSRSINLEDQLEYKATLEYIDQLVRKLPEKRRVIFMKSRIEGKSTKEIAIEMSMAPGTVDNHISAALKFIRENLSENSLAGFLFLAFFI